MADIRPIDANALVEYLDQLSEAYNEAYEKLEYGDPHKNILYGKFTTIVETILQIKRKEPTLDYEPVRHGEWIESTVCVGFYECSQCRSRKRGNQPFFDSVWNYCPNCGAKMDGGKENV